MYKKKQLKNNLCDYGPRRDLFYSFQIEFDGGTYTYVIEVDSFFFLILV